MDKKRVNMGCGEKYMDGWINIDHNPRMKTDILFDFEDLPEKKLPIGNNTVDEILAQHVIEHLWELIPFMNECYRILKPTGILKIISPRADSQGLFLDPTHKHGYWPDTFRLYFRDNDCFKAFYDIDRWTGFECLEETTKQDEAPMVYLHITMTK